MVIALTEPLLKSDDGEYVVNGGEFFRGAGCGLHAHKGLLEESPGLRGDGVKEEVWMCR